MSRREDIDNAIWSDPEFFDLSPNAKLVYIWSFTNPRCGMAGLYKLPIKAAAMETGLDGKFQAALAELVTARFVFYVDGVLWVRSRVKHMRTRTNQIAKSIAKDVAKIGSSHPLRCSFMALYGMEAWLEEELGVLPVHDDQNLEDPIPSEPLQEGPVGGSNENLHGYGYGKGTGKGTGLNTNTAASRARTVVDQNALPDDFPTVLVGAVDAVTDILERVASVKGAIKVNRAGVARVIATYPLKDHVKAASAFEVYWIHGAGQNRKQADVVAGFRNWIDREPDMAPRGEGVARLRPAGFSHSRGLDSAYDEGLPAA